MPANILQCKMCAKPFQSYNSRVCPTCMDQIDEDFATVRDYLYDHPQSRDMNKVAEETGVERKIIIYLMEEKRLVFKEAVEGAFVCGLCGKAIMEGKMCDDCRENLARQFEVNLSRTGTSASVPDKGGKGDPKGNHSGAKMHIGREK